MTARVGVLALQGDVREHQRALAASGATPVAVRRPAELDTLDGIIIPGGESTTIDKLLRAFGLFEPLRERVAGGLAVFGSCAGMILLADSVEGGTADQQTLGGLDVVVRRNAFGRQVDSFETDLDIAGLDGGPFHAVFIRAPLVASVGEGVEVLARVDDGQDGRIVAVRSGRILATSFHPEVTDDHRIHQYFISMLDA